MQRNRNAAPAKDQPVDLPTNMRLLLPNPRMTADVRYGSDQDQDSGTWTVHDIDGNTIGPALSSRPEALRAMGGLTLHGALLPLILHGPDGEPTGDRLG